MAIFIPISTPSLATARFFSAKETNIKVFRPSSLDVAGDFCTCIQQCIPDLPAFTDEIGADFYKNDVFAIFINTITDGTIVATLTDRDGTVTNLTDDTYGTYISVPSSNYFRFEVNFYKVWLGLGYGSYTLKVENLNGSSSVVKSVTSPCFQLKFFTTESANRTVRIETFQFGILKHGNKYADDNGLIRVNQQIRLYGALTFNGQSIENSSLQLNNDQRSQIQIKDQLFPEYNLEIHLAASSQINFVLLDYLFANDVKISDFNVYNFVFDPQKPAASFYRSIPVKRTTTDFAPSRTKLRKTFNIGMEYNNKNVFKINQ